MHLSQFEEMFGVPTVGCAFPVHVVEGSGGSWSQGCVRVHVGVCV